MCLAPFLNAMVLCCKKYTTKKYYHFLVVFVIIGLLASQWALDMDVIKNFVLLDHTAKEAKKKSSRRFLNYTSSVWEMMWLHNISQWEEEQSICQNLLSLEQAEFLHKFQVTLCTHHLEASPWCAVDDPYTETRYLYNKENRTYSPALPDLSWEVILKSPPQPVVPPEEDNVPQVFSRFYFCDENTGDIYSEYIEPLVSHLRHPIAMCDSNMRRVFMLSRSFIVPVPSGGTFPKAYYFDAGASSWNTGAGGPSLSYFTEVWKRHGIDFDRIEAWEGKVTPANFYATVPENYKNITFYHQEYIASSPETNGTFVPFVISNITKKEDYVFFKLDIDNGAVEKGTVDYLLSAVDDSSEYIDEFVWEHHAGGNYLMRGPWGRAVDDLSIFESYQYFLRLRLQGVRAHSYV